MEWSGGRSSLGVDREMVEKFEERERDKCNDGDVELSLGGVLRPFERVLRSFGGAPKSFGGVLKSFEVDTDIKKPPVDVALSSSSSSLLFSGSEMYLAMSSRISSGDKIYGDMSSAESKASSSSTTGREGGLEVVIV